MSKDVTHIFVKELSLYNFRNYHQFSLNNIAPQLNIVCGENGFGKTNLLEAISLLSASKGLRAAKIADLKNLSFYLAETEIKANLNTKFGLQEISSKISPLKPNQGKLTRIFEIDGNPVVKRNEITDLVKVFWVTPAMQYIFTGASSDRRNFFDHLVFNFFPDHAEHSNKFEKTMRERLYILKKGDINSQWLNSLEQTMNISAVKIWQNRNIVLKYLNDNNIQKDSIFAQSQIELIGDQYINSYLEILKDFRKIDSLSGRTNKGPHSFDMRVTFVKKQIPANLCSTGEQKSLILNIIFSQLKSFVNLYQTLPILLLDELVSHLDHANRDLLFYEIVKMNSQVWLTGVDQNSFNKIAKNSNFIPISK